MPGQRECEARSACVPVVVLLGPAGSCQLQRTPVALCTAGAHGWGEEIGRNWDVSGGWDPCHQVLCCVINHSLCHCVCALHPLIGSMLDGFCCRLLSAGAAFLRQHVGGVIQGVLKHVPGPGSPGAYRQLTRALAAAAGSSGSGNGGGGAGREARAAAVKAARILLGATAVAGVSLASLPALLSTPWGLRLALNILNYHQPGTVDVQSCSLALSGLTRGSVTLEGVTLHEPVNLGGHRLLLAKQVVCSGSLFELYTGAWVSGPPVCSAGRRTWKHQVHWSEYCACS
jgi:hypothetical protein